MSIGFKQNEDGSWHSYKIEGKAKPAPPEPLNNFNLTPSEETLKKPKK